MKGGRAFAVVLVTAPDLRVGRRLARAALHARLAACVNLVPRLESHYWWRGRLERGREVLLVFKTRRSRLTALEKLILQEHPYDTPEFVVLPIAAGTQRYLDWISESLRGKEQTPRRSRPRRPARPRRR
jgi:periplasmic divalent cation tolerance protein